MGDTLREDLDEECLGAFGDLRKNFFEWLDICFIVLEIPQLLYVAVVDM